MKYPAELTIIIRGAGDLATGVALRLYRAGFRHLLMLETAQPLAVRRMVSFSEAVHLGEFSVEGITAGRVDDIQSLAEPQPNDAIPVLVDPAGESIQKLRPDIVIDGIMAKRNIGTGIEDGEIVIGIGPGFTAGKDVNYVIETKRGHALGRVIRNGSAAPDTGIPGEIGGYSHERLLRAPRAGIFEANCNIGDKVEKGECVANVNASPVVAGISGVLRGLLCSAVSVEKGTKLGDIDPRGQTDFCSIVSDKALAVGGGVLEAILEHYNKAD